MRLLSSLALVLGLAVGAPMAAAPADAAGIGIVLLHARGSWPGQFDNIVPKLQAAGYQVIAPETCWSVHRLFSATVEQCQGDIDVAISGLKGGGSDRIVLAGLDLGGMDAIYYAGIHPGIAGVIVWGPRANIRNTGDEDLNLALAMIKNGQPDLHGSFGNGRTYATPTQLLSFDGPNSVFADQDALLKKINVPFFWMAAQDDLGPRDPTDRFNEVKANPLNKLEWAKTDMFSMVDVQIADVIDWLNKLKLATTVAQ